MLLDLTITSRRLYASTRLLFRLVPCLCKGAGTVPTFSPPPSVPSQPSHLPEQQLRLLCARGRFQEALSLFQASASLSPSHSSQTYALLIHACAHRGLLPQGQAIHRQWIANNPTNPPDLYLSNHLINMYAKCGCLDSARHLFDEMPHRNVVSWSALVSGYAQHGRTEDCFRIFSEMLGSCLPTEFALSSVLTACGDCARRGRQLGWYW